MGTDLQSLICSSELRATGDHLSDPGSLPWVPQSDGVSFRLLSVSPEQGTWTNLLRVTRQGTINLHRHLGQVEAWVIAGRWRYLEHDWVASAGMYVFEPQGDVHTLVNAGEEEMITLFVVHGPIEYLGADGQVSFTETANTKLARWAEFCEANGLSLSRVLV